MKIVSISGMIGAGKDTLALHLVEKHGFIKGSFSAALKDAVAAIFGWDRILLDGITPEARLWRDTPDRWWTERLDLGIDVTPRWVLQFFGTEVMRSHFHEDIWIASVERWISNHSDKSIVFTDTRFLNEFSLLHGRGAIMLGVYRKIPKWLESFYQGLESRLLDGNWPGVMAIDVNRISNQKLVISYAKQTLDSLKVALHESEIQLLVWNRYKGVIDNQGKLQSSIEQLESFL